MSVIHVVDSRNSSAHLLNYEKRGVCVVSLRHSKMENLAKRCRTIPCSSTTARTHQYTRYRDQLHSLDQHIPVHRWHQVLLQQVRQASFFSLIDRESFQWFTIEVELSEDALAESGDQRTACIPVVLQMFLCGTFVVLRTTPTFGTLSDLPSMMLVRFCTRIEFEAAMAAAVLLVGRLVQSPMAKTLRNFLCWSVSLVTSTKPLPSASADLARNSCGAMGAPICRKSYWKYRTLNGVEEVEDLR